MSETLVPLTWTRGRFTGKLLAHYPAPYDEYEGDRMSIFRGTTIWVNEANPKVHGAIIHETGQLISYRKMYATLYAKPAG